MGSGNTCKVANDTFKIYIIMIVTKVVTRVSYLQLKVVTHILESGNTCVSYLQLKVVTHILESGNTCQLLSIEGSNTHTSKQRNR